MEAKKPKGSPKQVETLEQTLERHGVLPETTGHQTPAIPPMTRNKWLNYGLIPNPKPGEGVE